MRSSTAVLLQPEEPDVSGIVTEDETPVDNLPSEKQQRLLTEPLYSSWSGPPPGEDGQARPFVAAANVGLFPALHEPPIVPDVFLSLDVQVREDFWAKKNRTYFFWEFGKAPEIVIEIVSNREGRELGEKRARYARAGIPYYVVFDPAHHLGEQPLHAFELHGRFYVPTEPWFGLAGLGLVLWEGTFEGIHTTWLRWRTADGAVVPTGAERATDAEARATDAEARARRLAARLRAMGIDPDSDGS
ncbi:Uma2 family endonuclease [Sorangium sp. So ce1036]|uniref:Uma2 family endonuclease n=1 Tax=Sorangium sp. So ce1036 TaxID=3133328 RepID=UPI003F0B68FF